MLLALLLPVAVLLLGLAMALGRWSRPLAIAGTILAGVVVVLILVGADS